MIFVEIFIVSDNCVHVEDAYLRPSTTISRLDPLILLEFIVNSTGSEKTGVIVMLKLEEVRPTLFTTMSAIGIEIVERPEENVVSICVE